MKFAADPEDMLIVTSEVTDETKFLIAWSNTFEERRMLFKSGVTPWEYMEKFQHLKTEKGYEPVSESDIC